MIKIKKLLARKMYYRGHTITIVPCKCDVNNKVAKAELNMFCGYDTDPFNMSNMFDRTVREFEYLNCNKDTGCYAHYYVTKEAMEQYNMCKLMCN